MMGMIVYMAAWPGNVERRLESQDSEEDMSNAANTEDQYLQAEVDPRKNS
jgi:hypothetical protein